MNSRRPTIALNYEGRGRTISSTRRSTLVLTAAHVDDNRAPRIHASHRNVTATPDLPCQPEDLDFSGFGDPRFPRNAPSDLARLGSCISLLEGSTKRHVARGQKSLSV